MKNNTDFIVNTIQGSIAIFNSRKSQDYTKSTLREGITHQPPKPNRNQIRMSLIQIKTVRRKRRKNQKGLLSPMEDQNYLMRGPNRSFPAQSMQLSMTGTLAYSRQARHQRLPFDTRDSSPVRPKVQRVRRYLHLQSRNNVASTALLSLI